MTSLGASKQISALLRYALCIASTTVTMHGATAQTAPAAGTGSSAEVFVQTGNSLMATMVRMSPDGQRVATCDGAGLVVAWDALAGRQFREVYRHTGLCMGLAYTPDGKRLISSGGPRSGNEVVMSDVVRGEVVRSWQGHSGFVLAVAATPDSRGAWSLGEQDGLRRWSVDQASAVQTILPIPAGDNPAGAPNYSTMVLSADQQTAFVARRDGSVVTTNLVGSGTTVLLAKLSESISSLALSPDGAVLAVAHGTIMGSKDRDVVLLDTASGREIKRLQGHAGNVFALAFSPDGKLLASAAQIDTTLMISGGVRAVGEHEALRLWRLADGALVSSIRNQRNARGGSPFLRGSLDFSLAPNQSSPNASPQVALAMWDEAVRVYEFDNVQSLRLVHTLEGRGLSPLQIRTSDKLNRLMATDARRRVALQENYLQSAQIRNEFGKPGDWTPERVQRLDSLYGPRGMLSPLNHAALWDLKTGRLERIVDWQRSAPSDLSVDAQGRFVSVAALFPSTTLLPPLRTHLLRQSTADDQGNLTFDHFGYEPWDGKPGDIFVQPSGAASPKAAPSANQGQLAPGSYRTDTMTLSPGQRFVAIAALPFENPQPTTKDTALQPRIFVQERLASGERKHKYDITMPGIVRAMAISADERTLWASGTTKGQPYDMSHQAWLIAINLVNGKILRQWSMAQNITVDLIVAHPSGQMAITNGGTNLSIWDTRQAARKYFIKASADLRPVKAVALTADGKTIAASDTTGWTVLWDWPANGAPIPRWSRQVPSPSPHLLTFMAGNKRLAAGSADGSIRLLSNTDGGEIARMIRFDNDEWITITPEGYFVASQDGDRWVNVRMDDKVYGIDQFYDVFYRPDIVERRLADQPIAQLITVTLQDALKQPPPRVTLGLPEGPSVVGQKVKLDFRADTQGGGVGELRVLHNGKLLEVFNRAVIRSGVANRLLERPAPGPEITAQRQSPARAEQAVTRALRLAAQSKQDPVGAPKVLQQLDGQVEVELAAGENVFSVVGFNSTGNLNARPVTRRVMASGTAETPRVFILAVGIDIFKNANLAPTLANGVKDSTDVANAFRERLGSTYKDSPVIVRTLQNLQATRAGLDAALVELQREVRSNDLLVWFVASHGTLDNNATYGIVLQDWDGKEREGSLFSTNDILEASRRIKAFNQIVILDTCHAGGASSLVRGLYDARLSVLARNMGLHIFASASATEEALDGFEGNGLFTHTLLKGLRAGVADKNTDRVVTVRELGEYARRETIQLSQKLRMNQEPLLMNFGKDVTVYAIP
jgi:WD40 repeat protein